MDGNYKIFNDLSKIRSNSNKVLYVSLILTFVSTSLNIFYTYKTNESAKNNFYLLDNGQKLAAVRIKDHKRAVDILCEGHIANFHELFFALEPDLRHIKRNIEGKALYMGDHSVQRLYNRLIDQNGELAKWEGNRIDTKYSHGTGCTLSAAIATNLAKGSDLVEAIGDAREYVRESLKTAPGFGSGHGPMGVPRL